MDYSTWARAYKDLFPLKEETLEFLREHLNHGVIADIGCANGSYAKALAIEGNRVEGYDITTSLIELARKNAADVENLSFDVLDMRKFKADEKYDGIYTIGNSLVHLLDVNEIEETIRNFHKALKKNGRLIVQIINYDRILTKKIDTLPTIEGEVYSMKRKYSFNGALINFRTILKKNSQHFTNEVFLYPLKSDKLESLATHAGFKKVDFHDGFTDKPFDKDESFALVAVFEK